MSVAGAAPGARAELQRQQRIALTRRMETGERGRRHPGPGARVDETPERARVERADRELDRLVHR